MAALITVTVAIVAVIVFVVGFILPFAFTPARPHHAPLAIACPDASPILVGKILVPRGPVVGYCQDELANAAAVINAGKSCGVDARIQAIGVMTAIGESGLRNLTYGDKAGPDSRGILQQRANWGSLKHRMDPYKAARSFFIRLLGVPNWPKLTPTQAAHAVQRNADPDYYTQYYQRAENLVAELSAREVRTTIPAPAQK